MPEVQINNEHWRLTGHGDHQMLHYSHPDAPSAAVPIHPDAVHLLSMLLRGIAFQDVVEVG